VNLQHTFRHHIITTSLFRRLNLLDIGSYYHNRVLRWAGHSEHFSYFGDRSSKTVKAYSRRVLYRAWGLTDYRGRARLMLDRRSLVQAPNAPRAQSLHPRARNDYDEEAAYDS